MLQAPYIGKVLRTHEAFRYVSQRIAAVLAFVSLLGTVVTDQNRYAERVAVDKLVQFIKIAGGQRDISANIKSEFCSETIFNEIDMKINAIKASKKSHDLYIISGSDELFSNLNSEQSLGQYSELFSEEFEEWGFLYNLEARELQVKSLPKAFNLQQYLKYWEGIRTHWPQISGISIPIDVQIGQRRVHDLVSDYREAEGARLPDLAAWLALYMPAGLSVFGAVGFALQRRNPVSGERSAD